MQRNMLEVVMGAVVLLAAAGFIALAYEAADMKGAGGYQIIQNLAAPAALRLAMMCGFQASKLARLLRRSLIP